MASLEDVIRTAVVRIHCIHDRINTPSSSEERAIWVALLPDARAAMDNLRDAFDARGPEFAASQRLTVALITYECSLRSLFDLEAQVGPRLEAIIPRYRAIVQRNIGAWRALVDQLWDTLTHDA